MSAVEHETVRIAKTAKVCPVCERYVVQQGAKPVVVMCCEGACLRGEVARRASNLLCHQLAPDTTARLCLGGAFTEDAGQRALARNAKRVVAIEGCFLECATRMMKGVVPELAPEVIVADKLCQFDRNLFGVDEMSEADIQAHAAEVATAVLEKLRIGA